MKCRKCEKELPEGAIYCCWCGISQTPTPRTPKKRGNGQGSVYQLPNGKWRATITVGYTADGKRKTVNKQFSRKTDAILGLRELSNMSHSNVLYDMTFEECLEKVLEQKSATVSAKTVDTYKAIAKKLEPVFKMKMSDIKTEHLQKCFDKVENYKTKNTMRAISRSVFQYALQNDICTKDYTDYVQLGKDNSERHEPFTMDEILKFKSSADNGDYTAKIMMCLICTGLRPIELFSMKKTDYFDNCLHGGAKTEAGKNRIVPVSPIIEPYIQEQLKNKTDYLFPNNQYKQIQVNSFRAYMYNPLAQSLGIDPSKTPYSARHSFASLLNKIEDVTANRDIASRQALMGHSTMEMTKHYTHADIEQLSKLTDGVSELICNASCNSK